MCPGTKEKATTSSAARRVRVKTPASHNLNLDSLIDPLQSSATGPHQRRPATLRSVGIVRPAAGITTGMFAPLTGGLIGVTMYRMRISVHGNSYYLLPASADQ